MLHVSATTAGSEEERIVRLGAIVEVVGSAAGENEDAYGMVWEDGRRELSWLYQTGYIKGKGG